MEPAQVTPTAGPKGIGGWLIAVAIGVCLAPVRIGAAIVRDNLPPFKAQIWGALTTPTSPAYHPLWAPLLVGSVIANVVLLALSIGVLVLFFRKKRSLPSMAITFMALGVLGQGAELAAMQAIPAAAGTITYKDVGSLIRAALGAAIWIPYFLRSKRVRATFVE